MTLEIHNFINRAEHKIADLASAIVESDGDTSCLSLLLNLAEAVDHLTNDSYPLTELDQLKLIHYWSKEANLTQSIYADFPVYKTLASVLYTTYVTLDGDIIGGGSVNWDDILLKPLSFSSSIPLVQGLQNVLDTKADKENYYTIIEIDNKFSSLISGLKWKNNVATVADLVTTYPDATDGWAAIVDEGQKIYRFDGDTRTWEPIGSATYQKVTQEQDGLMSKEDKKKLDNLESISPKYTFDIPVSLSENKTLGKYKTGQTASFINMTIGEILKDIAQESIKPTVSISTNLGQREYNKTDITAAITMSHTINTLGATLVKHQLERTRDGVTWITLYEGTIFQPTYSDAGLNPTPDNRTITYRSTVTDTSGTNNSAITTITFKAYVLPSTTGFDTGPSSREKGDHISYINGIITRNSPHIPLVSYKIQYKLATGDWITIEDQPIAEGATSVTINTTHNDTILDNADLVIYRVLVTDTKTVDHSIIQKTITFIYASYLGYSTVRPITVSDIEALGNKKLTSSMFRTIEGVTSTGGTKTYYFYDAKQSDLNSIIMDGAAPVLGAFIKLPDITGVNALGATVTYRGYESNSTNAFTNNTLAFS